MCLYGSKCKFSHADSSGTTSIPAAASTSTLTASEKRRHAFKRARQEDGGKCLPQDAKRKKNSAGEGTKNLTSSGYRKQSHRPLVRKSNRAASFRRFLIDEFGVEFLRSGAGILDVAGGCGEISFLLENLSQVTCSVVDPRPLNLRQQAKKLARGIYTRNTAFADYNTVQTNDDQPATSAIATPIQQCRMPKHFPTMFLPGMWRSLLHGSQHVQTTAKAPEASPTVPTHPTSHSLHDTRTDDKTLFADLERNYVASAAALTRRYQNPHNTHEPDAEATSASATDG